MDAQARIDAAHPGFATAVDLERDGGGRPADALPEVLARTPGASVRSLGGLGQFSSVSLRGSSGPQVAVLLDGVPLGSSMAGLVDLSEIPLDTLTRVEIHRGYVPIAFGGATMGGAVNLVSAPGTKPRLGLDAGVGSFGARQSRGAWVGRTARGPVISARFGYAGADGDFPYLDFGTPQNPDDDVHMLRINNGYDRLIGQVRVDGRAGKWRLAAQEILALRTRGVPGPAGSQWDGTRLTSVGARTIASARRSLGRPGGRVQWVFGLGGMHRRFRDPANAVGLAVNNQITRGIDTYLSPRLRLPMWPNAYLGLVADQRTEWVEVDERAQPDPTGDATRWRLGFGAGVQLEQLLLRRRWLLVPAYRVDGLDNRFAVASGAGEQADEGRDNLVIGHSPRLASRVKIGGGVQLRGSVGRYFRPPTLVELFGDRGFAVGNEGLRPERGTSVDGGVVVNRTLGPLVRAYAQAAGFWARSEDLIQWVNAGFVTRPVNVAGARVTGAETSLELLAWGEDLALRATYTFVDSRNLDPDPQRNGEALPGRPRHDLYVRLAGGHAWTARGVQLRPRLHYDLELVSSTFLDLSGRLELPTRVFHGIGAELQLDRRVTLTFQVRNLLDARTTQWRPTVANFDGRITVPISDFIGFPLPGRSMWGSIRVDLPTPGTRRKA